MKNANLLLHICHADVALIIHGSVRCILVDQLTTKVDNLRNWNS